MLMTLSLLLDADLIKADLLHDVDLIVDIILAYRPNGAAGEYVQHNIVNKVRRCRG